MDAKQVGKAECDIVESRVGPSHIAEQTGNFVVVQAPLTGYGLDRAQPGIDQTHVVRVFVRASAKKREH
ncbi:MAG: hypothetical protein E6R11_04580 [Rhodocyclaceae bacterium]|jgi:hypothetical protein|nr:MAG: hypothetical protein E6R11_04580 [Rhodocyclaceae bacterium]